MNFFLDAADRFTDLVTATTDWSAPSPCEGWTATDVLDHIVDTQRDYLTRMDLPVSDRPSGSPTEVWAAHLAAVRPVAADEAVRTREYDGFFGRTTIGATLDDFYGFDMIVHGWDLGSSQGAPTTFTEADMAALEEAMEGYGEHAYDDGVFGRPVEVPADASRQTKLLARMGRQA